MAIEPKYPNSAGRLLAVLDSLEHNKPFSDQLAVIILGRSAIKNEKDKLLQGLKAVGELHKLYVTFLEDLDNTNMTEDERSVLINGLASLYEIIYPNPAKITGNIRRITDAEKALLEVCATRIENESVITEEDLSKIRQSIDGLRESATSLPKHSVLREVILELARLSDDAVNRFNIYGARGLKYAFKNMLAEVAEVYMHEETKEELKDNTTWDKAVKHIKLVDAIAGKVMKYQPLLEQMSGYLLPKL